MPFDVRAKIVRHQLVNPDHHLLTLQAPPIARAARPGQFVMLQIRRGSHPLLRRPMSIHRVLRGHGGSVQILYKVVGAGTSLLSEQRPGAYLAVIGPLGNGFRITAPRRGALSRRPVLVAGGIGIAVFPYLAEALVRHRRRPILLFGARRRRDLVATGPFRNIGVVPRIATEDGSRGTRGFVTDLLNPLLAAPDASGALEIFACGPVPMLRAVARMAADAGVPCQLALEAHMSCGIGACLGCVVSCRSETGEVEYRRVCTEGPIFDSREVLL